MMMVVVVIGGRGCGLVCLADRRREGRLGRMAVFAVCRGRDLRGQQELLHQGRRVVRMRVGIGDVVSWRVIQ